MKILPKATLIIGTLLASNIALAEDYGRSGKPHRDQTYDHGSKHQYDRHQGRQNKRAHKRYANENLRLNVPVHVRGNDRIRLRRAINRHYDINLDQYRLKRVVVHNSGRRPAAARLNVGYTAGDVHYLVRGKNPIHAPRNTDGRWLLGFKDARVDNVRVVLEPKPRWAYSDRRWNTQRPWFEDGRPRWSRQH